MSSWRKNKTSRTRSRSSASGPSEYTVHLTNNERDIVSGALAASLHEARERNQGVMIAFDEEDFEGVLGRWNSGRITFSSYDASMIRRSISEQLPNAKKARKGLRAVRPENVEALEKVRKMLE